VLASPAFYIGALGSSITQAKLRRLHGPIGLKVAGRNPQEIALEIMAEIVAVQHHVVD